MYLPIKNGFEVADCPASNASHDTFRGIARTHGKPRFPGHVGPSSPAPLSRTGLASQRTPKPILHFQSQKRRSFRTPWDLVWNELVNHRTLVGVMRMPITR